jgi:hypothetical protein
MLYGILHAWFVDTADQIAFVVIWVSLKNTRLYCSLSQGNLSSSLRSEMTDLTDSQLALIEQIEALVVRNSRPNVSLDPTEVVQECWGKNLLLRVVTTREINYCTSRKPS